MNKTSGNFPFTRQKFNDRLQHAVGFYWDARLGQARRQKRRGRGMPVREGK